MRVLGVYNGTPPVGLAGLQQLWEPAVRAGPGLRGKHPAQEELAASGRAISHEHDHVLGFGLSDAARTALVVEPSLQLPVHHYVPAPCRSHQHVSRRGRRKQAGAGANRVHRLEGAPGDHLVIEPQGVPVLDTGPG